VEHHGRWLIMGVLFANLPDIDYLPGILIGDLNAFHHGFTHSLGWITVTSLAGLFVARATNYHAACTLFLLMWGLQASHLAMDMMTDDGRAPYGIMALWPIFSEYLQAPFLVFSRIEKANYGELFQGANAWALFREIALCLPLLIVAGWYAHRSTKMEKGYV
jgi:inner membrane protein